MLASSVNLVLALMLLETAGLTMWLRVDCLILGMYYLCVHVYGDDVAL